MKDQILIIGDIAGRYNELQKLLKLATEQFGEYTTIAVGDLVDRGKDSNKVVEYFRTAPDTFAIRGNHEDMMVDYCKATIKGEMPEYNKAFRWNVWLGNGGEDTVESYKDENGDVMIPEEHVKFLDSLPLFIEHEDAFGKIVITHAPINPTFPFEKLKLVDPMKDWSLCWNRGGTRRMKGVDMQFHGHNANRGVEFYSDNLGKFAVDIDTSRGRILTGMLWPTLEVVQVEYETPPV